MFLLMITKDFLFQLGCGGGLPGLCAVKNGAKYVLFQDFVSKKCYSFISFKLWVDLLLHIK